MAVAAGVKPGAPSGVQINESPKDARFCIQERKGKGQEEMPAKTSKAAISSRTSGQE